MAQEFFGISRATQPRAPSEVSIGTTDTGTDVQIVVVTGVSITRQDINVLVNVLMQYINGGGPSGQTVFP